MTHTGLWAVTSGNTPSFDTGPSTGQSGRGDRYAYTEVSSGTFGTLSVLTTPVLALPQGGSLSFCMSPESCLDYIACLGAIDR